MLAPELELKLAVVAAALLLSFCSRQKLKRKQIPLLSRTIRVPFSSLPPITQKSLGTFYAYVDFTFNLTLPPERFQLSLPWDAAKVCLGDFRPPIRFAASFVDLGLDRAHFLISDDEKIAGAARRVEHADSCHTVA